MLIHPDLITRARVAARTPAVLASLLYIVLAVGLLATFTSRHAVQAQPPAPAKTRLDIRATPLANFTPRTHRAIDTVVLHYMSGIYVDRANWDDPALCRRILRDNHVSAHYLIARDGTIDRLVDERNLAWHAGGSIMPSPDNRRIVNRFSIGIEMIATERSGFTEAQYRAVSRLIEDIRDRYPIRHVVGHDEIAGQRAVGQGLRRDVKPDPGPRFDWSRIPGR